MPALDVSEVLTSPEFTDFVEVVRRPETVGTNGRSVVSPIYFPNIAAVVTVANPNDLETSEDYRAMTRTIEVITKFPVQGAVTGSQPDLVIWKGSHFVVQTLEPYPQFGPGFVQATCTSVDKTDASLLPAPTPTLRFNAQVNSQFLSL